LTPASEFRFFGEGVQQRGMMGTFGQMSKTATTGEVTGVKAYRGMKDWERFEFENYYLISELRKQGLIDVTVFQALKDLMKIAKDAEKTTFYDGYKGGGELYKVYLGGEEVPQGQPEPVGAVPPQPKIVPVPEYRLANVLETLGLGNALELAQKAIGGKLSPNELKTITDRIGVDAKSVIKFPGGKAKFIEIASAIQNIKDAKLFINGDMGNRKLSRILRDDLGYKEVDITKISEWYDNYKGDIAVNIRKIASKIIDIYDDTSITDKVRIEKIIDTAIESKEFRDKALRMYGEKISKKEISNFL
jgi:hypothetical protein